MAPKTKVKNVEQVRKAKREAEKRRRAKIKADPVKYAEALRQERERRIRRKKAKKILTIEDLTPRQQRIQRKNWREKQQKCRENKKIRHQYLLRVLRENTPPSDINSDEPASPSILQGCDVPQALESINEGPPYSARRLISPLLVDSRVNVRSPSVPYRKERGDTPLSNDSGVSRQRLQGIKIAKLHRDIRNRVIEEQRKTIYKMKKKIHTLQVQNARLGSRHMPKQIKISKKRPLPPIHHKKVAVRKFLEEDTNSIACPGKKDTITKHKIKKQKRILCDSLERLHKKYNSSVDPFLRVGYATFCRLRPFWIVHAKLSERDTCLCVLHENFNLMVDKLRTLNIIDKQNMNQIIESAVCNTKSYECMHEKCHNCVEKPSQFKEFENEQISYKQWIVKSECRLIKGKEKVIKRTVKDNVLSFKKDLVEKLVAMLPKMLSHCFNIQNQYVSLKTIKENLKSGEVLLHIDFSENYSCKYFSEAQAVHFGASRQQISLQTGVMYFRSDSETTESISFCTISECLRHDACAVYAHLKKVVLNVVDHQNISVLHIASDGPSSQYKNKNNFYLFTQHLLVNFNISEATWNYSESGHGKGAPDGVGAAIKRTADSHVAHGNDIPDFSTFFDILKAQSNVLLYKVSEEDIIEADHLLKSWTAVRSIAGTKNMHQLTWTKQEPSKINLRELSCIRCSPGDHCQHFPSSQHYIVKQNLNQSLSVNETPFLKSEENVQDFKEKAKEHGIKRPRAIKNRSQNYNISETGDLKTKMKIRDSVRQKYSTCRDKSDHGINTDVTVLPLSDFDDYVKANKRKLETCKNEDEVMTSSQQPIFLNNIDNKENKPSRNISVINQFQNKNYTKGDFVIVKFLYNQGTRKCFEKRFVGEVIDFVEDNHFFIKFMRKSSKVLDTFFFPQVDDEQLVHPEQVVTKVAPVKVSRGRYLFEKSIRQYNC